MRREPPRLNRATVAAALSSICLCVPLAGCAPRARPPVAVPAADVKEGPPLRFFPPPFALAAPEDAIVRIVGPQMNCSGALVDDDLILTAHHCVVERGPQGEYTKQLVAAKDLHVELGGDYLAWGQVRVAAVVAPPCGEGGGGGDVAVLVLQHKLVGLSTLPPRLEGPPRIGEELEPVGFGRCSMSSDGIHRQERPGGTVVATTAETIHLRASICPGDSGGPALARGGGEVVGVISMSAMDGDDRTSGPSVLARIDTYRAVFAHARLVADGTSPSELPPLSCAP